MALQTCSHSFRLFFYRTRIGCEGEVIKELRKVTSQFPSDTRIFYVTGSADVVVAVSGRQAREALLRLGTIAYITGSKEIICDAVDSAPEPSSPLAALRSADLVSITTVRLKSFLKAEECLERSFLDWWERELEAHPERYEGSFLLKTLGGPEFIIVRSNQDLDDFAEFIIHLTSERGVMGSVRCTHTMIGFGERVIDAALGETEPAGEAARIGDVPRSFEAHIGISWRHGNRPPLLELAGRWFGAKTELRPEYFCHPGSEDMTVVLRTDGDRRPALFPVFQALLGFRREARRMALATNTRLYFLEKELDRGKDDPAGSPPERDATEHPADEEPPFAVSNEQAEWIMRLKGIGPQILGFLYHLSDVLDDREIFNDIAESVYSGNALRAAAVEIGKGVPDKATTNHRIEKGGDPDQELMRNLWQMLHHVREGLHQRLHGSQGTTSGRLPNAPHPLGGVNKVLLAANTIPHHVLSVVCDALEERQRAGEDEDALPLQRWSGLVNLGPFIDYEARRHYVITLPEQFLFRPNRWIGLVHESVHGLIYANEHLFSNILLDEDDPRSLAGTLGNPTDYLHREFIPDAYDFHFSPTWMPWMWYQEFWQYMRMREHESFHSIVPFERQKPLVWLRPLLIWAFHQSGRFEYGNEGVSEIDLVEARARLIEMYRERLESADSRGEKRIWAHALENTESARVKDSDLSKGSDVANYVQAIFPVLNKHLPFDRDALDRRRRWFEENQVEDLIAPTDLYREDLEYPVLFLWKLWEKWAYKPPEIPERAVAFSRLVMTCRGIIRRDFEGGSPARARAEHA